MPWLKNGFNDSLPSVIWQPNPPINFTKTFIKPDSIVLDVGAGGRKITPSTLGVDFQLLPNTSVVADIHQLSFKDNSVDVIFCTGTFEHILEPGTALNEFYRILKKDGIIHVEVPFMQPYHLDPIDMYRWTKEGLKYLVTNKGFSEIKSGIHLGPMSAINEILMQFFQSFFSNRYIRKMIVVLYSLLFFWTKYLDYFLIKRPLAHYLASGVYFIGKKQ